MEKGDNRWARPGFASERLIRLIEAAVERCSLDLSGAVVLTEAATGPYIVTPVIAALAGAARVIALVKPTAYGSLDTVTESTRALAKRAGMHQRIEICPEKLPDLVAAADIVTNSGHVRPIDAQMIAWMRPETVVSLMYEAWEFRPGDIDLHACSSKSVAVAGTNERHPAVDVFSYLGMLAVRQLNDAGIPVYGSHVLVLCDNPFEPHITHGLRSCGATVDVADRWVPVRAGADLDAVLVALQPRGRSVLDNESFADLGRRFPTTVVVQFWGDLDREALDERKVPFWPPESPRPGHMGILLSALGPEPIVRLQTGGLKVGEILWRARAAGQTAADAVSKAVDSGYANELTIS